MSREYWEIAFRLPRKTVYIEGKNKDPKVGWDHFWKTLNSIEFEIGQNSVGSHWKFSWRIYKNKKN